MKRALIGIMLAGAMVTPAIAQAPSPAVPVQWPWPQAASAAAFQRYPLNAPTPDDAYRERQITRWELERIQGPVPQALQGPSTNGQGSEPGSN